MPGERGSHKADCYIVPVWLNTVRESPVERTTNEFFDNFKQYLDTCLEVSQVKLEENVDNDDLIYFNHFVEKSTVSSNKVLVIFNRSLVAAVKSSFRNGEAKELGKYLISLFMGMGKCLVGKQQVNPALVVNRLTTDRDCFLDGFLLERKRVKKKSSSRSSSSSFATDDGAKPYSRRPRNYSYKFNTNVHYNEGQRKADVVGRKVNAIGNLETFCIVECKSNVTGQELREAVAQTLSYGLSTRDTNQSTCELDLLIITPVLWCHMVLPPYSATRSLSTCFEFKGYHVFVEDPKGKIYLKKNGLLSFLRSICYRH